MKSFKEISEALKGNQHKIDKNKNGKIDAHDFKLLRKEESEIEEAADRIARADYKVSPSGRKSHKEIVFKDGDDEKKEKLAEVAPPGFEGTVKVMKKKKEIDNPYALAWSMYKKGYKSHKNSDGTMKEEIEEQVRVGDKVHLGIGTKGGAGHKGTVHKIDGDIVHVNVGSGKFGDRIIKGHISKLTKEETLVTKDGNNAPRPGTLRKHDVIKKYKHKSGETAHVVKQPNGFHGVIVTDKEHKSIVGTTHKNHTEAEAHNIAKHYAQHKTVGMNDGSWYHGSLSSLHKEEVELKEANFASAMQDAIAAHHRGNHTEVKRHLANAGSAFYFLRVKEFAKHQDLIDKYKKLIKIHKMHEDVATHKTHTEVYNNMSMEKYTTAISENTDFRSVIEQQQRQQGALTNEDLDVDVLDEAVESGNKGNGYHGQHDSEVAELEEGLLDTIKRGFATGMQDNLKKSIKPEHHHKYDFDSVKSVGDAKNVLVKAKQSGHLKEDVELDETMVSEDFEQLDELSGGLLGRYIQKARSDISTRHKHGQKLDSDPKVSALDAKLSDYYGRKEYTKSGESKHRKQIDKTRADIEKTKKKLDPEYPKSVSTGKRYKGIETAIDKLRHGKLTNEDLDVDVLDEAVESGNKGNGYHGQHDSEVADKKYSAMHTKVKKIAGEAGHLRDAKKPNVMVKHYLDSKHGRHLAGNEHDHDYIKKDFGRFKNAYKSELHESEDNYEEGNLMAEKLKFSDFIAKINEQLLEYESDSSGVYRHTKKSTYGKSYQGDDDEDEKPKKVEPEVKRGRGRPTGSYGGTYKPRSAETKAAAAAKSAATKAANKKK